LEGVPPNITVQDVETALRSIDGVLSVHDLHVWSLCSHLNALSGHLALAPEHMANQYRVLEETGKILKDRFGIVHTTLQVESNSWPSIDRAIGHINA